MGNNVEHKKVARRSLGEGGKMHYVYLLESKKEPDQTYIGITDNLVSRFKDHNAGRSPIQGSFVRGI